jgi:hypothetical protein
MTSANMRPASSDIARDPNLSGRKKLERLLNLEEDQKALMRADDENMQAQDQRDDSVPAELLCRLQDAERRADCGDGKKASDSQPRKKQEK